MTRRLAVKIGSALLITDDGQLRQDWLEALAADVAALMASGWQVVLVSSGAIRLGLDALGLAQGAKRLGDAQAAAALGQIRLAQGYRDAFAQLGLKAAQVLLTLEDSEQRRRYLNARTTLLTLLNADHIPIVNENDTVATEEIRFGDNDRLAARVATMVGAELLVLLSDVDGLYTRSPGEAGAEHLAEVNAITAEIQAMAAAHRDPRSRGGMATKLMAAQIATRSGCALRIAEGRKAGALGQLMAGKLRSTLFTAQATPQRARAAWISGVLKPTGQLSIDAGAIKALGAGKSLLPAGVLASTGQYGRGDCLSIVDEQGREVARGLSLYDASEAEQLYSLHSDAIEGVLGYSHGNALVHADDLVITRGGEDDA